MNLKMEKTTKMVEELTKKRKMTKEVKDKLHKRIFQNCLLAIAIMLCFGAINLVYIYTSQEVWNIVQKVSPMIFICLTVGIFELAYRKDSGKMAIVGMEWLIFSVIILYIPKIYGNLDKAFCIELSFAPIFCGIYYVAKSILLYLKTQKEYQNNLSDVKEIVKDEV